MTRQTRQEAMLARHAFFPDDYKRDATAAGKIIPTDLALPDSAYLSAWRIYNDFCKTVTRPY